MVQASIYEKFKGLVGERVKKIKVGHPLDPATEIGPLIHPKHVEKVLSYMDIAKSDGATIAVGGNRAMGGQGNYVERRFLPMHASRCASPRKKSSARF